MPTRSPPLTANFLNNLKPNPDKTLEYSDGNNLVLRVHPSGKRTWVLKMRHKGVMGTFPVGEDLGLKEARNKAAQLRVQIKAGTNPNEAKKLAIQRAKATKLGVGTLEAIVDAYFESGPGAYLKSKNEQRKRIKSVFASQLKKSGQELKMAALQITADTHSSSSSAARAVAYINPIFKWAAKRDLVQSAFLLERPYTEAAGDEERGQRHLSIDELTALLPCLDNHYGRCAKFILLTAARRTEACEATWAEIDFDRAVWTIPLSRRKDTRSKRKKKQVPTQPFSIPLSEHAISLLNEVLAIELQRRDIMKIDEEITSNSLVFNGVRGGELRNWDRWLKRVSADAEVFNWSAHDLRRTAATLIAELGFPPHMISVILGHKNIGGQLLATYNKSQYFNEHKKIMEHLGMKINSLNI